MYLFVLYLVVYAIKGVDPYGSSNSEVWDRADETVRIIDLVNKAEKFEVNSTLRSVDDKDDDDDKDDGDKDADDKAYGIERVDLLDSPNSKIRDGASETARIINLVNKADNLEVKYSLRTADNKDEDRKDKADEDLDTFESMTAIPQNYDIRKFIEFYNNPREHHISNPEVLETYKNSRVSDGNPQENPTYAHDAQANNQLSKSRKCRSLRSGGTRTDSDEHMTLEYESNCSEDEDNVGEFGFIDESKSIDEANDPEQGETSPNNLKEIKDLNAVQADEILKPIIEQMLTTYTININQENKAYKSKEEEGNANIKSKGNSADTDVKLSYKSWESKINVEDFSSEGIKSTNEQTNKEPNGESSNENNQREYIILQNNMSSNTRRKETNNNEGKKRRIKNHTRKSDSFEMHRKSLGNRDLWSQKNDSFIANERKSEVWNNQDTKFNDFIEKPDTMNEKHNFNKKQDTWNRKDKLKNDENFDDKWNKTIARNNNKDKWDKKDDWNKKDDRNKKDDWSKKDDWNKKDDSWNKKERIKNNDDDKWDKKDDWNRKDDWNKPDDSYSKKYDKDNKKDDQWSLRDDKRNKKDDNWNKKDDSWNKKDDKWNKKDNWNKKDDSWNKKDDNWNKKDDNWNKKDDNWNKKDDNWDKKDDNWNKKDDNWNKKNDNWNKKDDNWNLRDDKWNKKDDNWNKNNDRSSNKDDSWNKRDSDDYNRKGNNKYDDKDNNFNYKKDKRNQRDDDWDDRDNYRNKKSDDWYSKEKRNKKKNVWDENENSGNIKKLERGDLKRDSAWDNVGTDSKNAQWGNYEVFKKIKEKKSSKEDSNGQEKINFPKIDRSISKYSYRDNKPPKRAERDDYYEKPKRGGNSFARTAIPHIGKRPVYD